MKKLAVSNIAWQQHDDPKVLRTLRELGVSGLEVAPTKVWPDWQGATEYAANGYRQKLENEGFCIPAMQAIVFGKPELHFFDPDQRSAFLEHIKMVADLGASLGVYALIFGAPNARRRQLLTMSDAMNYAVDILQEIGDICDSRNTCFAWEHNPAEYNCDFITSAADGRELINRVNNQGVQLHLDSAGLHLAGGSIRTAIEIAQPAVHYHASEPMLGRFDKPQVDHKTAGETLRKICYDGWISIEMREPEDCPAIDALGEAVLCVKDAYGL